MLWSQLYSLRSYVRSSLWIVPFIALMLYALAIRLLFAIDAWITWEPIWPWGVAGTQMMLQTIITLTLTFMVFTFGSLLVAIQIAGGQLTPRIIASTLLGDNAIRFTVGLLIFTLLFATGTLARIETKVPQGVAGVAGLLGFGSIAAFLYLIDYAARLLRPVSIVWRVGERGRAVIESVYPDLAKEPDDTSKTDRTSSLPGRTVTHHGRSSIVLAVNLEALVDEARAANTVIEFLPRVGDFVGVGEPLFRLHGSTASIDERRLGRTVAFGPERTIEQDSTFAFRIIVDIAIKALSKAINDPTTAVLCIDQLQRLLRLVGSRQLHGEKIADRSGQIRVIFRTPNWTDFVNLTFSEIRFYGAENIQIARRLRAMIETLLRTLPEYRHADLRAELDLLDRTIERLYTFPEDLALARVPNSQGIGGAGDPPASAV